MTTAYTSSINIFTPPQITPLQAGSTPVYAFVGTSVVYNSSVSGLVINRSNATVAMTDTLLAPGISTGDIGPIPNGYTVYINNLDASAAITLTPQLPATINGASSLTINAGTTVKIVTDGINYFSQTNTTAANTSTVTILTGTTQALGSNATGSTIIRHNSGTNMTDTLVSAATLTAGWFINLINNDATAIDTITPTTSTINGAATFVLQPGQSTTIYSDGTNYYTNTNQKLSLVTTSTGTPKALGSFATGGVVLRSNSGSAMSDTLVAATTLPNGWYLTVINNDTVASDTITPTTSTIDGAATLVIPAGHAVTIYGNGTNYFTNHEAALSPVITSTGSPKTLQSFASGSVILRSNATTAMADSLPNANTLPNGWNITIFNVDASATDTITPATSTINGTTTLAITFGLSTTIYGNGVNYFATTPA